MEKPIYKSNIIYKGLLELQACTACNITNGICKVNIGIFFCITASQTYGKMFENKQMARLIFTDVTNNPKFQFWQICCLCL
jgi:hypothetical protein